MDATEAAQAAVSNGAPAFEAGVRFIPNRVTSAAFAAAMGCAGAAFTVTAGNFTARQFQHAFRLLKK